MNDLIRERVMQFLAMKKCVYSNKQKGWHLAIYMGPGEESDGVTQIKYAGVMTKQSDAAEEPDLSAEPAAVSVKTGDTQVVSLFGGCPQTIQASIGRMLKP